jgi:hypothetical protein
MDIYNLKQKVINYERLKEVAAKKLLKFYELWSTKAEADTDLELYQKVVKAIRVTSSYVKFTVFNFKFKLKATIYSSQNTILLQTYLVEEDPHNPAKLKLTPLPEFDLVIDEFLTVKHNSIPITGNFNKEYIDLLIDFHEENNRFYL